MDDAPALTGYCAAARGHPWHGPYHDREYGFPVRDDDALFERLMLEVNQAGLSWLTVLKKREGMRRAYDGFRVDAVAAWGDAEKARVLAEPGVVRNRLKVEAAVANARAVRALRDSHGSITGSFLMATGWLPGSHDPACPVHASVLRAGPPWARDASPPRPTDPPPAP